MWALTYANNNKKSIPETATLLYTKHTALRAECQTWNNEHRQRQGDPAHGDDQQATLAAPVVLATMMASRAWRTPAYQGVVDALHYNWRGC